MSKEKATGPDPARTLALLWGGPDRVRPGPKPALGLDHIVGVAMEIADHDGLPALTMRRVATELGVGQASLYTYVPGRQELLALMLDAVAGNSTLPHTFPGSWRDRLEAWAREDWAEFHRHPWALQVVSGRSLPGPNILAWYDSALTVLGDTGLAEREKVAVIEAVDGFVRGLAWNSTAEGPEGVRDTGTSEESWQARSDQVLAELVDLGRYPALAATVLAGVRPQAVSTFELGLQQLLDGVEQLVLRRSRAGGRGTRRQSKSNRSR